MPTATDHAIQPHRAKGRPRTFDRAAALENALGVFWAKGFAPATIAELCQARGINPPSLYAAFGNKAQLFVEAVEHYALRRHVEKSKGRFQRHAKLLGEQKDAIVRAQRKSRAELAAVQEAERIREAKERAARLPAAPRKPKARRRR